MPRFIVDLWLDGYDTEEEMEAACKEFIYEQLNFSGSGVTIKQIPEVETSCNNCGWDRPCDSDMIKHCKRYKT